MTAIGLPRVFPEAPTLDTGNNVDNIQPSGFTPRGLRFLGHAIQIDLSTGSVSVQVDDCGVKYFDFLLGVGRRFESQSQVLIRRYEDNYPNVEPKLASLGNWTLTHEAAIEESWLPTMSELSVRSGLGIGGLSCRAGGEFHRRHRTRAQAQRVLAAYGVPQRTLQALGWTWERDDFLLRTLQGPFRIASGSFRQRTLVDPSDLRMFVFDPVKGCAFRLEAVSPAEPSSRNTSDRTRLSLVALKVDQLGHRIDLNTSLADSTGWHHELADGSGRRFRLSYGFEVSYPDPDSLQGVASQRLLSSVRLMPSSQSQVLEYPRFQYHYDDNGSLRSVSSTTELGERVIQYAYGGTGELVEISDGSASKLALEYVDDPLDCDEQLAPRRKVARIADSSGLELRYSYEVGLTRVEISSGGADKALRSYSFVRDREFSDRRFISRVRIPVTRGYTVDAGLTESVQPRTQQELIEHRVQFSKDGRFNIEAHIDPSGATWRRRFNEFNQVISELDPTNNETRYAYSLPVKPSPNRPHNYDLIRIERDMQLYAASGGAERPFVPVRTVATTTMRYGRHEDEGATTPSPDRVFSDHRVIWKKDAEGQEWTFSYDRVGSALSTQPTMVKDPWCATGEQSIYEYNGVGLLISRIRPTGEESSYKYDALGNLTEWVDENGRQVTLEYYRGSKFLSSLHDQRAAQTTFTRDVHGRLMSKQGPEGAATNYSYQSNGRLASIDHLLRHKDVAIPASTSKQTVTFTASGFLRSVVNASGTSVEVSHDEAGRRFRITHQPGNRVTKFVTGTRGLVVTVEHPTGAQVHYGYDALGRLRTEQHSDWNDGGQSRKGKKCEYEYDTAGNLTLVDDSDLGATWWAYDRIGRPVAKNDLVNSSEMKWTYLPADRRLLIEDQSGEYTMNQVFDSSRRTLLHQDGTSPDESASWHYSYGTQLSDKNNYGRLSTRREEQTDLRLRLSYDAKGAINQVTYDQGLGRHRTVASANYRLDDAPKEVTGFGFDSEFDFDDRKQVVYQSLDDIIGRYDLAGNRLYWGVRQSGSTVPSQSDFDSENQLLADIQADGPFAYTYDDNGDRVRKEGGSAVIDLRYDADRRLRHVLTPDYDLEYEYDSDGRLVRHIAAEGVTGRSVTTSFVYHSGRVVRILSSDARKAVLSWDSAGQLLRVRSESLNGSEPFPNSLFPISDVLALRTRFITASGAVRAERKLSVWGRVLDTKLPWPLGFLGHLGGIRDPHTNLILHGSRWYDPLAGRWIGADHLHRGRPPRIRDLRNLYTFAGNNPLAMFDHDGRQSTNVEVEHWEQLADHFTEGELYSWDVGRMIRQRLGKEQFLEWRGEKIRRGIRHKGYIITRVAWDRVFKEGIVAGLTGGAGLALIGKAERAGLLRTVMAEQSMLTSVAFLESTVSIVADAVNTSSGSPTLGSVAEEIAKGQVMIRLPD